MGIKYTSVVLECDYGCDKLTVYPHPDRDGTVVFRLEYHEDARTVYVTAGEAREFAESILIAAAKSEA